MRAQRLEPRLKPSQKRAGKTVALILDTAGALLAEDGFEELTTNKICKAAGLTPPALYRYFPNKYAVVTELAQRLMTAQNAEMAKWANGLGHRKLAAEDFVRLLESQIRLTREHVGGAAIMRTLYATPQLANVRLTSHRDSTVALAAIAEWISGRMGDVETQRRLRLAIEIGNSTIEMVLEETDLDEQAIIRDTAEMIEFHLSK